MGLKWRTDRQDANAASECGRFSVTSGGPVYADGQRLWMFIAWARSMVMEAGYDPWGVIGSFSTMEAAKKACRQHAISVYRDTA
jgi:hypothetical protein